MVVSPAQPPYGFRPDKFSGSGAPNRAVTPEAKLIFNAFTTAPTTARKFVIDDLVRNLKACGVWATLDLFYVLAAETAQAALVNWKCPGTFNCTATNSPTFTADRGYAGNGSTSRLDTNYNPASHATNYALNSASMWVWVNTNGDAFASCGNATGDRASIDVKNGSNQLSCRINDQTATTTASADSIGFFGAQRTASNARAVWKNGVSQGSTATVSTGVPNATFWICGANAGVFDTRQVAAMAVGASIAGYELPFYNAMLAYMQAVGNA